MLKTATKPVAPALIERLARVRSTTPTVISCYLRVDPAARRNRAYLADFLRRVRDLTAMLEERGIDPSSRKKIAADLERIARWLGRPGRPPGLPGIAVFAASDLGLFETIPLARVHRNRIDVDTRPLLHQLVDAQETLGRYLAVLIDRERARFFDVAAADTEELSALIPVAHRGGRFRGDRRDAPGWGEHAYNQRIAEEKHRHYSAVAAEIGRLTRSRPYQGIVLLGPTMHTTALAQFLPERSRAAWIGSAKLNPKSARSAEVARATWELQRDAERRSEGDLLDRLESAVGGGWAVNGVRETLHALARGQVRELIVPDGAKRTGFRCASGELAAVRTDCRDGAEPAPVAHLIDEAIEDALRQRAGVVVVDDPATAARIDGLAATLRFR